jgi:peroxiredoxin Q/BCP
MIGISPQSVESHESFTAENGLNVPLLSDPDKEIARSYGVVGPGGYIRRSIFLIDGEGIVRYRHVAMVGLAYQDAGDLERAVAQLT